MTFNIKIKTPVLLQRVQKKASIARKAARRKRTNLHKAAKRKAIRDQYVWATLVRGRPSAPLIVQCTVRPLELYPEITSDVRRQLDEREQERNKWKKKKSRTRKPKSPPIVARNPTPAEIKHASAVVNMTFKLYDHGHVRVFDKEKKNKIIADINFTDIKKMRKRELMDLRFLCSYLNDAKLFIYPVRSKGRACAGIMWAIGWRKSMKRYEIIGRYKNQKNIRKYNSIYRKHLSQQKRAGEILWNMFHKVGNVALKNNRQYMRDNNIPGWADEDFQEKNDSPHSFASNLTFTSNGFFNHHHMDEGDNSDLPFAFLLCLPTFRATGELATKADGYNVQGGEFIFRDCQFGIRFKPDMVCKMIFSQRDYVHGTLHPRECSKFTKLGMSLQISQKTTNTCKRIKAREFDEYPSMYYGGATKDHYCLKKT